MLMSLFRVMARDKLPQHDIGIKVTWHYHGGAKHVAGTFHSWYEVADHIRREFKERRKRDGRMVKTITLDLEFEIVTTPVKASKKK